MSTNSAEEEGVLRLLQVATDEEDDDEPELAVAAAAIGFSP